MLLHLLLQKTTAFKEASLGMFTLSRKAEATASPSPRQAELTHAHAVARLPFFFAKHQKNRSNQKTCLASEYNATVLLSAAQGLHLSPPSDSTFLKFAF